MSYNPEVPGLLCRIHCCRAHELLERSKNSTFPSISLSLSTQDYLPLIPHSNLSFSLSCKIPQDGYYKYLLYIPHLNASSSSQVARPSPAVLQSPSPFSSRCPLVVVRSGRTQSPPWTLRNLRRNANRPTVKGRFLPLPLIFHQTKLKVNCPSCQRTTTTLTTA